LSGKTCPKLGDGNPKKRIFLLKKFRRSIKIRGRNGKFLSFAWKKAGKIIPTKRKKSQKTDNPDEKSNRFFRRRAEKCRKTREKKLKNLSNHTKKA
jgi:hypothetical protein